MADRAATVEQIGSYEEHGCPELYVSRFSGERFTPSSR
jgi:hypothetical protein